MRPKGRINLFEALKRMRLHRAQLGQPSNFEGLPGSPPPQEANVELLRGRQRPGSFNHCPNPHTLEPHERPETPPEFHGVELTLAERNILRRWFGRLVEERTSAKPKSSFRRFVDWFR